VDIVKGNMGWAEVVVGPMFSGKSEELIVVGASDAYEARCRRCFEPNPAHARRENGPQVLTRNRAAAGGAYSNLHRNLLFHFTSQDNYAHRIESTNTG
jgi:hypothetical protein